MQPSNKCYELIKRFEGLVLDAYPDPATHAEPFTIGYGTTVYKDGTKVKLGDTITDEYAEDLLKFEIDKKALSVDSLTKSVALNQNQFDSLVSLAYNIGIGNFQKKSSVLRKLLVNPNDQTIKDSFMLWNKAAGQVMKGLTRRREAEANIYFS